MIEASTGPMVIGHRGAPGYRPEHTSAAYELAIAFGADALEPDLVASADGVLVVRHENEISETTDVATRPEFADRRTTKEIDDRLVTGWFTEDFTWAELRTLRTRERMPSLRPHSARADGRFPIMRLAELVQLLERVPGGGNVRVVTEFKHPTYFRSLGLPLPELFGEELRLAGRSPSADWLSIECFEKSLLAEMSDVDAQRVYLAERSGAAYDLLARDGALATTYAQELTGSGLSALAALRDARGDADRPLLHGVSVHKSLVLRRAGNGLVEAAHRAGLQVWTWTLRPENRFLAPEYRDGAQQERGRWHEEFAAIMATGVDAVFTDFPDLAVIVRSGAVTQPQANFRGR